MRIKDKPEDFLVEEMAEVSHERDDHLVFKLKKTNWDTMLAIKVMARKLGVSQKRFGFAGLKDKNAVTCQKMSVYGIEPDALASLKIPRLEIGDIERGDGIKIGDLKGNRFTIRVRDVSQMPLRIDNARKGFPNYFGIQRFGEARPVTHIVGSLLLKGRIEEAATAFIALPVEREKYHRIRRRLYEDRDFSEAKKYYPKSLPYERAMLENMDKGTLQAFKALPRRLNTLFIHAAQAFIFNKILARRCEEIPPNVAEVDDVVIAEKYGERACMRVGSHNIERINRMIPEMLPAAPIVGYKTRLYGRMKEITEGMLEEEGLRYEDFAMPAFPSIASRGTWREMLGIVSDLKYSFEGGTLDLDFFLPRGCYATTFLDHIFEEKPFI